MYGSTSKEKILQYVSDPQKIARVNTLTEEEAQAITSSYLTETESEILQTDPMLHQLRVIYYRRLTDWATGEANQIQDEIFAFIDSESFVQYPEFMDDETIMNSVKVEHINNHSRMLSDLKEYEVEILGARINQSGNVEVLITYNQVHTSNDNYSPFMNFSQKGYDIPPRFTIGHLKQNPALPIYGRGNEIYVSMGAPYPGAYIETVIGEGKPKQK